MPRDGSNVFSVPAGTIATTNTTIESAKYNAFVADVETDLNTPRPIVAGGTGASSASAARTALGLAIGTDVQAYDAELAAIAALAVTDGNVIVGNGTTWVAESGATARASLGLTIGTDVQAYDAELTAIAGLTSAANKVPMFSGSGTATLLDFKDEDNMASDSATAVPSQQSVKAYVDTAVAAGGGMTFLSTVDLANDATADFTLTAGYDAYVFVLANVIPANDTVQLLLRTSTDGGSTFDSGASTYAHQSISASGATLTGARNSTDTSIPLTISAVGSDAGETGVGGVVHILGPSLALKTYIMADTHHQNTGGIVDFSIVRGWRSSDADVDAIRFLFSAGNLESGTITLWGMKNA